MDRKDLVKKILELSLELKDAEGVQAMMCITDMEHAVKDYEKQLRLYSVSQQRELLIALANDFKINFDECANINPEQWVDAFLKSNN